MLPVGERVGGGKESVEAEVDKSNGKGTNGFVNDKFRFRFDAPEFEENDFLKS